MFEFRGRRFVLRGVLFLASVLFAAIAVASDAHSNNSSTLLFGTLLTDPRHAAEEFQAGERVAMIELSWAKYEPVQGRYDETYAARQRETIKELRRIGFAVTLGLGLHHAPQWCHALPNAHFVDNQGSTSRELNFIFNAELRKHAERYFQKIDTDLGLTNFWAIRITSGGCPELMYPDTGSYWAFDPIAQGILPGRPADVPACPFPGWKPGKPTLDATHITTWADWYLNALVAGAAWQIRELDKVGFRGWYQVLTPGLGLRPAGYQRALAKHLPHGLLGVGAVWHRIYAALPDRSRVVVYVTSVGDGSGKDDLPQQADRTISLDDPKIEDWSAARWQTRIAHEFSLPIAGENPGYGLPASQNHHYRDRSEQGMMARALAQAQAGNFQAFYWAHGFRLRDQTLPFGDFASRIKQIQGNAPGVPLPPKRLMTPADSKIK